MPMFSGVSIPSRSRGFCYALFTLDVHPKEYKDFLNTRRSNAMPSNGDVETGYSARDGFDRDTGLGSWSRH